MKIHIEYRIDVSRVNWKGKKKMLNSRYPNIAESKPAHLIAAAQCIYILIARYSLL